MEASGRGGLPEEGPLLSPRQSSLHRVIFEADTPAGRWFDILLIVSILTSVAVVMLDSVLAVRLAHGRVLSLLEWFFTFLFTVEYVLRLACSPDPRRYAVSLFGVVDLLAILPTYLSILFPASRYLTVIRVIRILRVFRVLKLVKYVGAAEGLMHALWASRRKITVFLFAVLTLVTVFGSLMYVIEGEKNGFTSIPRSIYWAIVTMTTVGYGDISPRTGPGQMVAAVVMILGYAIIAVPTGIVTAEMTMARARTQVDRTCPDCGLGAHGDGAGYCRRCGSSLAGASGTAQREEGRTGTP